MEELNSNPAKDITEETTTESFWWKDQNAATEALKEKVTNQISEANWWERRTWSKSEKVEGNSMIVW